MPREVVLYSRDRCHLCADAKVILVRVQGQLGFNLKIVDVDSDPMLQQEFRDEVPVVFIDNRKAFKFRVDEKQLLRWF